MALLLLTEPVNLLWRLRSAPTNVPLIAVRSLTSGGGGASVALSSSILALDRF